MTRPPIETTSWVAGRLLEMNEVENAEVTGDHSIRITRQKLPPFTACILATDTVTVDHVLPKLEADKSIEMVVNIPRESKWTEGAINAASFHNVAFGAMKDLMSAMSDEVVKNYVRKEFQFVERGLTQHRRVTGLTRETDRLYVVHRRGLPSVRFVLINEYELTGDHIRQARQLHGEFEAVLLNNPNGKPTSGANEVAKSLGARVFKWGQFLGRLNA